MALKSTVLVNIPLTTKKFYLSFFLILGEIEYRFRGKRGKMEFASTIIGQKLDKNANSKISQLDLDAIFAPGYGGRLNSLVIVSAYTDVDYNKKIIELFKTKTYKKRKGCHFSIYLDEKASRYNTDETIRTELDNCAKKIKRSRYLDEKSGIFLVSCGSLFHSKFIISKSNRCNKFVIGSINFTEKAFTKNEEIAIIIEANAGGPNSHANILIKVAEEYIKSLNPIKILSQESPSLSTTKSLRDLFLDGFLYRETKEQDPFRIQLNFPDDYLEDLANRKKTSKNPYLDSLDEKKASSLSLAKVFEVAKLKKPEYLNKRKTNKRYVWKQYSVECSLGYWVPSAYKKQVDDILTEKQNENKNLLDELVAFFDKKIIEKLEKMEKLKETFREIIKAFQNDWNEFKTRRKKDSDLEDWKWSNLNEDKIDQPWEDWKNKITNKLTNKDYEKYRERLLCGVTHFCVPDLWTDPISSKEFEESVCDSIRYSLSSKEKISKKLCAGVNKELIKKEGKYDIDKIKDDVFLKMLSSFISFLSFKNRILGKCAEEFKENFNDLDKFLSKFIEENYGDLKSSSEENQIKRIKQFLDKNDYFE